MPSFPDVCSQHTGLHGSRYIPLGACQLRHDLGLIDEPPQSERLFSDHNDHTGKKMLHFILDQGNIYTQPSLPSAYYADRSGSIHGQR